MSFVIRLKCFRISFLLLQHKSSLIFLFSNFYELCFIDFFPSLLFLPLASQFVIKYSGDLNPEQSKKIKSCVVGGESLEEIDDQVG